MTSRFKVSEGTRAKNRYGNFVRISGGDVTVSLANDDDVVIDASYETGTSAAAMALTKADARKLMAALAEVIGE